MQLNEEQINQYQNEGYVLLPGLIRDDELDAYDRRFKEYVLGQRALPADMKIMQDVMVVKGAVQPQSPLHGVNKLLCLENDELLFGFARHPELVSGPIERSVVKLGGIGRRRRLKGGHSCHSHDGLSVIGVGPYPTMFNYARGRGFYQRLALLPQSQARRDFSWNSPTEGRTRRIITRTRRRIYDAHRSIIRNQLSFSIPFRDIMVWFELVS